MIPITAKQLAEIASGEYSGPEDLTVKGEFRFDSREVKAGDIFLALSGEKLDGHNFIVSAFDSGAVLAVTTKSVPQPHIKVPEVLPALAQWAAYLRSQLPDLKIIGITGSQGKTTTKDILASLLTTMGPCIAPSRSFNNDLGVPITLLRCDGNTKFCILEMGARHSGDIARLTEISSPDLGIVLKVGSAHLGEFGSREAIAATKSELIRGLGAHSIAILGKYDEFTPHMADGLSVKKFIFGESSDCDVRAADVEMHGIYPSFDLVTPEGRERVDLQLIGEHQIANALAAAAAAFALGMTTSQIAAGLSTHQSSAKWRMELTELAGVTLLNDSYNASPESMSAALKSLALLAQERGGRSWAFLGRMLELGEDSTRLHEKVGELARELRIDHLVAVAEPAYLGNQESQTTREHFCSDLIEAAKLLNELEDGDVVLVKASRAEGLERLATELINLRGSVETGGEG